MLDDGSTPSDKTALMQAIKSRDVARAKSLILSGADVNYMYKKNWNALHYSSWEGLLEIVECILQKHIKGDEFNIDARTRDGQTALSLATYEGHEDIVQLLLEYGADINLKADANRTRIFYCTCTLLHHAACQGWLSVVEVILERKPNLEEKTCCGETALILSAIRGHREIVQLLLESGASSDCRDQNKWPLLHYVSFLGWTDIVKLVVLDGRCDINEKVPWTRPELLAYCIRDEKTALMVAFEHKEEEVAEVLIKHGAVLTMSILHRLSVNSISWLVQNGAYFSSFDYKRICNNFVLREQVLKDRDICTRAVVNEYNVACLPAVKKLSGSYNIVLPSIENLKINGGNALREIEKTVDREIETKGICNVMKVRPLVLQMMVVRSLLDYHYCQQLFCKCMFCKCI